MSVERRLGLKFRVRLLWEVQGDGEIGDHRELLSDAGEPGVVTKAIYWAWSHAHLEEQRSLCEATGRVDGRYQAQVAHAHKWGFDCNDRCELWDWVPYLEAETI